MPLTVYEEHRVRSDHKIIQKSIKKFNGNKRRAARYLGVTYKTIHNRLRAYRELMNAESSNS